MYKVVKMFTDLQDNNFVYRVGDTYPHEGKEVSEERIEELSGPYNKQGAPLIEKIEEAPEEAIEEAPEEESEEKPKAKRNRKKNAD